MTPDEVATPNPESTIVAGVAFSPHAQLIAATAFAFARRLGARVLFVHVGEDVETTRARLRAMLRAANVDTACELILRSGDPADVLTGVAEQVNATLLVTGALETEGMLQRIFGSVARKIARRALCPVLLLPLSVHAIPRLDRVVLGIRAGEEFSGMLAFTLRLLRSAGQTRLHVVQEADYLNRLAARYVDEREATEFENAQRSMLADTLAEYDLTGLDIEMDVLDDSTEGIAVIEYARRIEADLVITQAPPRALTLRDRYISHPADSVLFSLPCGILLYRADSTAGKE
ncbi:MAG: universal stress protein [Bacteroidota bacterium]|nr:universal stress protein [Bacteroidota bacterium]